MDTLPQQNHSTNYYDVRKKDFSSNHNYNRHLPSRAHNKIANQKSITPNIIPDEFDPNNYCITCSKAYTTIQITGSTSNVFIKRNRHLLVSSHLSNENNIISF